MRQAKKNDWTNVRGKKITQNALKKKINLKLINNRILIVVNNEIKTLDHSFGFLPNIYGKWIVN